MSQDSQNVLFAFPGQGSQYVGMGQDLCREFAAARSVYERAGDVLGYDLQKLSFNGPEEQLNLTKHTQPALLTHREVRAIHGEVCVTGATVFDNRTNEDTFLEVDAVLALIGFKPDLGPLAGWGLELERNSIRVNQRLETSLPGVYGAGDIVTYEGKLELIATGFSEAAMAVNHAVHEIDPKARYNPGHSTNLKVFKERENAAAEAAGASAPA